MNLNQIYTDRFQKLNQQQQEAVTTIYGPVMVVAGPGSGKTELLSMRVANILKETDLDASNILCLTFTDAACKNMQQRLSKIIGIDAFRVGIFTFHSFAQYVLNNYQDYFYDYVDKQLACDIRKFEVLSKNLNQLALDRNLRVLDLNGNFVFFNDIQRIITCLKKANIDSVNLSETILALREDFSQINQIVNAFFEANGSIRSLKALPQLQALLTDLQDLDSEVAQFLALELKNALNLCESENSTKYFTAFKNKFFAKDKDTKFVCKDSLKLDNLEDLAQVYQQYVEFFRQNGFRDFDDLILDLIDKIKRHPVLKANLQEIFQFILVDEFQDTSDAQMQLIKLLSNSSLPDFIPNLLVVGDDDQSIYKFQGANIKNILEFLSTYSTTKTIVLEKNYRSTQSIVDLFSHVIKSSDLRLESFYPQIQKSLQAANSTLQPGDMRLIEAKDPESELYCLLELIKKYAKQEDYSQIAVLARNHSDLRQISEFLISHNIPVSYQSSLDVFEQEVIVLVVKISKLLYHLSRPTLKRVYELLPEILGHPAFNIPTQQLWEFSREVFAKRSRWEKHMDLKKFPDVAYYMHFFKELSNVSQALPYRSVFDYIIGSKTFEERQNLFDTLVLKSPIKEYFLSQEDLESYQSLEALKSFIEAIEAYYATDNFDCLQALNYFEIYENSRLKLNFQFAIGNAQSCQLMTAHGAKGLEFETVIVFNSTQKRWGTAVNRAKLTLPKHLRLEPQPDDVDDLVRLFFVALSRAKNNLVITYAKKDLKNKDNLLLSFLHESGLDSEDFEIGLKTRVHSLQASLLNPESVKDENFDKNAFLRPIVDNFAVSISAILSFIDIVNSTPTEFLNSYMLRYPRSTSKQASYGNAMHAALNHLSKSLKTSQKPLTLEDLIKFYGSQLAKAPLSTLEYNQYLQKGSSNLTNYYNWHAQDFSQYDLAEYNMSSSNLYIEGFKISGSLDRVVFDFDKKRISVIDYKTGKPFDAFDKGSLSSKLKSFKYKLQLTFYKYLLQNHPNYKKKYQFDSAYLHFLDAETKEQSILEYQPSDRDMEFLLQIISAVLKKIKNLDFPDVSAYEKTYYGMREFIEDLITEKI
ncbi:ATP-dependent helicase [bacterium]|jgi:DNA helicase II / ATP-dependent DNA helicase PcrA|nr:ATP-dependent helicase [bacterium]